MLEAIARALNLDDAERTHLFDLARAAAGSTVGARPRRRPTSWWEPSASLQAEAGRDVHNKAMHDLVGELSTRSEEFRRRWSSHDVRTHGAGTKLPPPGGR